MAEVLPFLKEYGQALAVLVSTAALLWTIGTQISVWNRDRLSRGLENLGNLDERFEGSDFRLIRRKAADFLSRGAPKGDDAEECLYAVLNLFETIGYLHRMKMVDTEAVWHYFGSWIVPYYVASEKLISDTQAEDSGAYIELRRLYPIVLRIEQRRSAGGRVGHLVGEEAIKRFLDTEKTLSLDARPTTVAV